MAEIQKATREAVGSIGSVTDQIATLDGVSATIAAAMEEQRAAMSSFSDSIRHTTAAVDGVAARMIDIAGMVAQSTTAAESVVGVADAMRRSSDRVRAEIPAIVQEATRKAEQREGDRFSSSAVITLEVRDRSHPVRLVDVSRDGARIAAVPGVSDGAEVIVVVDGRRVAAKVLWQDGEAMGVQFHEAIDPGLLDRLAETLISRGNRRAA